MVTCRHFYLYSTRDINPVGQFIVLGISLQVKVATQGYDSNGLFIELPVVSFTQNTLKIISASFHLVYIKNIQRGGIYFNGLFIVLPDFTILKKKLIYTDLATL